MEFSGQQSARFCVHYAALRLAFLPSLFVTLVLLTGCASKRLTEPAFVQLQQQLPPSAELAYVPFYPQSEYQCGPAALATVLAYAGVKTDNHYLKPEHLVNDIYLPEREGSLAVELDAATRSQKRLAYPLQGGLVALLQEVAAGNPVLVMQNLGLTVWPQWHFAVVVGFDLQQQILLLRSGTVKRYVMNLALFERTWQRANRWARVITPLEQAPVTAQAAPFLLAAYDLEQVGQREAALSAYRTASQRWPGNDRAWLMRATAALQLNRLPEAENALKQALNNQPDNAIAWQNLAVVFHRRQCVAQKAQALRCAAALGSETDAVSREKSSCDAVQLKCNSSP